VPRTILLSVLLAVGVAAFVAGQEVTLRWTTYGQGLTTCTAWAEHRKAGGTAEMEARAWVAGFVTAAHYYHAMFRDILAPLPDRSPEAQASYIDQYCASPDRAEHNLSIASRALVNDMVKRAP